MQDGTPEVKAALRKEIRSRISKLTPEERAADSLSARNLLVTQNTWRAAASVMFYAPLSEEVDLWPLVGAALQQGKLAALPRFVPKTKQYEASLVQNPDVDLEVGRFGIREPNQSCARILINRLDLILVPGVAFDQHGRRLGRGKGFYDQLLATVRGTRCGVAFDDQVVRELPVEPHDVLVNCILTPSRWLAVGLPTVLE
jgi:5-formyltetrahydrofolate cyclo-ligase